MNGINNTKAERGLLPYPIILAATKGDADAMKIVMQHYESYINHLSIRKLVTKAETPITALTRICAIGCAQS